MKKRPCLNLSVIPYISFFLAPVSYVQWENKVANSYLQTSIIESLFNLNIIKWSLCLKIFYKYTIKKINFL